MHLYPEDSFRNLLESPMELPSLSGGQLKATLQGAHDALECHAKVMRTMAGRDVNRDSCFAQQSYACEADRSEAQLVVLGLLINAVSEDAELPMHLLSACERQRERGSSASFAENRLSRLARTRRTGIPQKVRS